MSTAARFPLAPPRNEPVLAYRPGSAEWAALRTEIDRQSTTPIDIPSWIDGRAAGSGAVIEHRSPHRRDLLLARAREATAADTAAAIDAANRARPAWEALPWEERAGVLLRAAELLAGRHRARLNAATMLAMSKTCHQAEIDSACELIDFWRFNAYFYSEILAEQPLSVGEALNRTDWRGLEGFVLAITPFNFTAIAGNLPTAPLLFGNTVVWKPATTALLPAWHIMEILREAGLPDGVLNMVIGPGPEIGDVALNHRDLAGVHFTGSTKVFGHIWATVGRDVTRYRSYPRLVGETGGKDFILAHPSADDDVLVTAIVRGGYEFQGQKCSAASRVYIPRSTWPRIRPRLADELASIRVGDPTDPRHFMGAVIDERAFDRIVGYIDYARQTPGHAIVAGGQADKREGFFIRPTLVTSEDPRSRLMAEEIFGPVVTVFVYDDARWDQVLELIDTTSPYALTGAVLARDRAAVGEAMARLRHAAGNFYINDKPTGAVVGQQPFGGGRASGTNDKAGSRLNLLRWASPRTIKENLAPPRDWRYPFLVE
jgi:1-pyrroline-5-carboxylate dehydrogenase